MPVDEFIVANNKLKVKTWYGAYSEEDLTNRIKELKNRSKYDIDALADDIFGYGVHWRIAKDNPKILADAIYTYSRLHYLEDSISKEDDTYRKIPVFMWHMLISVITYDPVLLRTYHDRFNLPLKRKHNLLVNRIMADLLYLNLFDDLSNKTEIEKEVNTALEINKIPNFYRNFLLSMKAIYEGSAKEFSANLDLVVKNSWRMRDNMITLEELFASGIPMFGLALYKLMTIKFKKLGIPIPPFPCNPRWDTDLANYVLDPNNKPEFVVNFAEISPKLDEWLRKLPEDIDITQL